MKKAEATKTIWVTKEGERVRVRDMTDSHLVNTVRFLREYADMRFANELADAYSFAASCRGDMASHTADQNCDVVAENGPEQFLHSVPTWFTFLEELDKRGLHEQN